MAVKDCNDDDYVNSCEIPIISVRAISQPRCLPNAGNAGNAPPPADNGHAPPDPTLQSVQPPFYWNFIEVDL